MKKKALITGAASGIGRAVAIRFAQEGYELCLNDVQEEKLSQLLLELPAGNHMTLPGSYADKRTIEAGEQLLRGNWGCLDVLVSCAGIGDKTDPVQMETDRWKKVFDMMLIGCVSISRLAARFMDKGGRIIHVSSIHGERAERGASSYSSAKAAINQFCRALALELADRGILVNAIAPGFVNTAMSIVDGKNELESEWFIRNYVKGERLPLRRAADPAEIAGVCFFLAGNDSSYITGQVITVDGGLTITF